MAFELFHCFCCVTNKKMKRIVIGGEPMVMGVKPVETSEKEKN